MRPKSKGAKPLIQTLAIIAAIIIICGSVTFAALQSPTASLTNNTINVGAADLRISTNGTTFTVPSTAGFTFDGVVPGGAAVPTNGDAFYLKNFSTNTSLAVKVSISTTPTNLGNVNLAKVYFNFTRADIVETTVIIPLQTLITSNSTGGTSLGDTLAANGTAQYNLKVSMDSDAYSGTGSGVSISGINLSFTGTGV